MQEATGEFSENEVGEATSVITCDTTGTVTTFSHGARRLFGYAPDEAIGKLSVAAFHPPENVATLVPVLLQTATEKGLWEEEVTLVKKGGERFRARLAVRPKYRDGKLVGYMGITRPLK